MNSNPVLDALKSFPVNIKSKNAGFITSRIAQDDGSTICTTIFSTVSVRTNPKMVLGYVPGSILSFEDMESKYVFHSMVWLDVIPLTIK